jgi:methyl-accepting chemotaxis protein
MSFFWKRTFTAKVMAAFGILIVLAVGLLFYVESRLNSIKADKTHLDQARVMIADARELQLSVANVWQFFTDASLTREQSVINDEAKPNYDTALAALKRLNLLEKGVKTGVLGNLGEMETNLHQMYQTGDRMFRAYSQDWDEGNKVMEDYDSICDSMIKAVDGAVEKLDKVYTELSNDVSRAISELVVTMLAIVSVIVLAGVFSAYVLSREITLPLRLMLDSVKKLTQGDLTHRVDFNGSSDLGALATMINALAENLKGIVTEVTEGAGGITDAAKEISCGVNDLSRRTEEQASTLEETVSSMEEMTSTVKQSADNMHQTNVLARTALEEAEQGGAIVNQTVTAMSEISVSSNKIADIIGVIDEIAFQTNLLALNAAVEAARAGEQGKGFAVVAAEVRGLAQRSAAAAKEIKGLIEDGVSKVKTGTVLAQRSGETLSRIIASIDKVADIAAAVSAASQKQSAGIEQINKAVMQMDEVTQQNTALVEQASAASRSMEEQAQKLLDQIGYFRMNQSEETAVAAVQLGGKSRHGTHKDYRPGRDRSKGKQVQPRHEATTPATDGGAFSTGQQAA